MNKTIVKILIISFISSGIPISGSFIGQLLSILLSFFGVYIHAITDDKKSRINNKVLFSSFYKDDQPYGLILGKHFIGLLDNHLWILSTKKFYSNIFLQNGIINNINIPKIKWWTKSGHCFNDNNKLYSYINVSLLDKNPSTKQEIIINKIIDIFTKTNYCISLISGEPGTGKSLLGMLTCKCLSNIGLKVNFIDTFRPTEPGHDFNTIYQRIDPQDKEVIVVLMDEIDICIKQIMKGIVPNQFTSTTAMDKYGWNLFLDHFSLKYKRVILIMTTNKSLKWFDYQDPSLMRNNRVNLKSTLSENNNYTNFINLFYK
jgi:hypothetical protein